MDGGYLDTTPIRPPPPGHKSNFVDPESRSYQLVIVVSVLSFLTIIFTSVRVYTRLRITHSFGIDDFCYMPGGGILGIHLWDVSLRRYIGYTKVSFFLFYRRLFRPVTQVKIMVWIGISLVVTFCVAYMVIDTVSCAPWPSEHGGWLDPGVTRRCSAIAPNLVTAGAYFSVLTDFYILAIPLQQVPKLRLSKRRKVGVSLVFLTGLLACGTGLTNLIFRQKKGILDPADFSWTIIPIYATA
ncbi:NAD(P)-binding protein [Apiospora kogelbergensis]|uniref:NAD(P)-binding protein n=1 Tax=Apiospora kogelbergensis TaxID=1337665 RepID=UPI00312D6EC2